VEDSRLELEYADFAVASLIFDSVFIDSLRRQEDSILEVQQTVEAISAANDGKPVRANDLANKLGIPLDRAYARLREAVNAGMVLRVNTPERDNRKFYRAEPRLRFIPDPEKLFQSLDQGENRVRFVHPITGEWITYSRKRASQISKKTTRKGTPD
jgi:hypothetical protein